MFELLLNSIVGFTLYFQFLSSMESNPKPEPEIKTSALSFIDSSRICTLKFIRLLHEVEHKLLFKLYEIFFEKVFLTVSKKPENFDEVFLSLTLDIESQLDTLVFFNHEPNFYNE